MSKEAMKLALEALNTTESDCGSRAWEREQEAISALREALAEQPAQQITEAQVEAALKAAHMHSTPESRKDMRRAIEATAPQPAQQQEPVVFYRCNGCGHAYEQVHPTSCDCMEAGGFDRVEYYTYPPAQRTWVGLTDEEIAKEVEAELTHYWNGEYIDTTGARDQLTAFARAIEAAHGIKENT